MNLKKAKTPFRFVTQMALTEITTRKARNLEELLRHDDVQVRTQAVWTLGQLGDGVGIAPLRRALLDDARPVRLQAAWALAEKMSAYPREGGNLPSS